MVDDAHPCKAAGCEVMVHPGRRPSGFCWQCESSIAKDVVELGSDLDKVLRLEAEFQVWCREHGYPDPHG